MMKQLIQLRDQLGWQGTTGLILLALTTTLHLLTLTPLEEETAYIHKKVDTARAKTNRADRNFSSIDHHRELANFFDTLPAEEKITDILAMISSVADASKVEIKQAEYQLDDSNPQFMEYHIVFPIQGEYANIRFFVFRVLSDHPTVALDQMSFKRDKINDALLKAEVRFTLFLKPSK